MKKVIIITLLLFASCTMWCQVKRGNIGRGNYTISEGTTLEMYGLDFDSDSNLEYVISSFWDMETLKEYKNAHLEYRLDLFNNVITESDEDYKSIKLLSEGTSVGMHSSFLGEGEVMFNDYDAISTTASYAGFMLTYGEGVHYGYARFHITGDSISWDAIYYNQTAAQAITVGDRGTDTGVEESNGGMFVAAAMNGLIINVVQENEDWVRVYEISGRMVGEGYGNNVEIDVPAAGVYVVANSNNWAKLVVR